MRKLILAIFLAIISIGFASAGELVSNKGMEGRKNHASIYEKECTTCHGANPKEMVDDKACIACHGEMKTIKIDPSKLPFPEANPHASVHFGEGASCLACHSEHKKKVPLCTECHKSWFSEM